MATPLAFADGAADILPLALGAEFDELLPPYPSLDATELDIARVDELPLPPVPLRCLVSTHGAECTECTPAPADDEEGDFLLLSDASRPPEQRGLKGLRAALLETREWHSATVRGVLADAAEAAGDPHGLAPLLRGKRARHLAKVHLIAMCRAWSYRSFHWKRRSDVKRKRRTAQGAEAVAVATAVASGALVMEQRLPSVGSVTAGGVASLLRERFAPELTGSAAALAGPRALAVARSCGAVGFAAEHVRAYDALAGSVAALAATWAPRAAAQARWSATARGCAEAPGVSAASLCLDDGMDAATTPAWRLLPHLGAVLQDEAPVEAMLPILRAHLRTGLLMWQLNVGARLDLVARSCGVAASADARALLPPEVASLHREFADSLHAGLAVEAAVSALLSQLRAVASLGDYAAAAEEMASLLARYTADAARALSDRAAWARSLVEHEGFALQPSLPIKAVPTSWDALVAAHAPADAHGAAGGSADRGVPGAA